MNLEHLELLFLYVKIAPHPKIVEMVVTLFPLQEVFTRVVNRVYLRDFGYQRLCMNLCLFKESISLKLDFEFL